MLRSQNRGWWKNRERRGAPPRGSSIYIYGRFHFVLARDGPVVVAHDNFGALSVCGQAGPQSGHRPFVIGGLGEQMGATYGEGSRGAGNHLGSLYTLAPLRLLSHFGQARILGRKLHAILPQRVCKKKCELWPVTGPGRLGASCQLAKGAWRLSPILLDAKK